MWPPLHWQNSHKYLPGSGTKAVLTCIQWMSQHRNYTNFWSPPWEKENGKLRGSHSLKYVYRGRIFWSNWDKSQKSQEFSSLLFTITPTNIVYGKLKSENSPVYAQKPQQNCTFMNSASEHVGYTIRYLELWLCMFRLQMISWEAGFCVILT